MSETAAGKARAAARAMYSHQKVRDRNAADLMVAGFIDGAEWQASRRVGVTAEMVERAARAGHEYVWARRLKDYGPYDSWDELDEGYREYLRGIQRAALSAALGGGEHE